jgi:hypothetical protein
MITEEHKKESLSRAFVQAVAAKAHLSVRINDRSHDYGIDGAFHKIAIINNKRVEQGLALEFQLKATTDFTKNDESVKYALDVNAFNMLANRMTQPYVTPAILILLCLPKDPNKWFSLSEDELILKNCCYWTCIDKNHSSNTRSVTIEISRKQLLSPNEIKRLFSLLEQGKKLI